ncbi:hypothetical protein [Phyllobacterium sp.]|uniref:hypothetical protein n=2 Tax=Pseudomonadota TaxID=1224 RepID=UPI001AD12E27|nr:hypothetical protein [Phyllobacterium sp.]MBQ9353009.1 hypothetical protein [Phyllobacterium sp.]
MPKLVSPHSADNDNVPFNRVEHLLYCQKLYSNHEDAGLLAGVTTKPQRKKFDEAEEKYVPVSGAEPLKITVPYDEFRAILRKERNQLAKGSAKVGCITTDPLNFRLPEERSLSRARIEIKSKVERLLMDRERARIVMRQSIGRLRYREANDNIDLPIVKLLKTEGEADFLKLVLSYRKLVRDCAYELRGQDIPAGTSQLVHKGKLDETTGKIDYKGVKLITGKRALVATSATTATPTTAETSNPAKKKAKPVAKPWNGDDAMNAAIDGRKTLERLHAALGPLVEPFEEAVLDSATLRDIGERYGCGNDKAAKGGGRAMLWLALVTLQEAWGGTNLTARAA